MELTYEIVREIPVAPSDGGLENKWLNYNENPIVIFGSYRFIVNGPEVLTLALITGRSREIIDKDNVSTTKLYLSFPITEEVRSYSRIINHHGIIDWALSHSFWEIRGHKSDEEFNGYSWYK